MKKKTKKVKAVKNEPKFNQADYLIKKRASLRDVGLHNHTEKLAEKKSYQYDLEKFLLSVFPEKFYRPFSHDQKAFIRDAQRLIMEGGQYAVALPRGEGKSTIISCAVVWAVLYGHKKMVVIACADRKPADRFMKGIKKTLEHEKLAELFPEICHYVKALAGLSQRAAGQLCNGKPTHIGWKANQINLPWVEMSPEYLELAKGAIIVSTGLTAGIRGLLETLPDGSNVRPDFLFLDDPQTRESAASPQQCFDRMTLIKSDLLPMAGIGTEISCLMACTVIEPDDLADAVLGEWQSTRAKALYKLPDEHDKLWKEYIELYREAQKHGTHRKECNDFYLANREAMDKGAIVGNEHRLNTGEISALQNIYNFIAKYGEKSFWSELQNEPKEDVSKIVNIKPNIVCSRLNHLQRGEVPPESNWLVIMADVNHYGINYVVTAYNNHFTGWIIDYGKYPAGKINLIEETEADTTTGSQKLSKGILEFVAMLYKKNYTKNGIKVNPNIILIDANYMTQTVHSTVTALKRKLIPIVCDRGRANRQYRPAKQDKIIGRAGNNYHYLHGNYGDEIVHNADYFRMTGQKAFLLDVGVAGNLSLWGQDPKTHEEFAYEVCSEKLVKYSSEQNFYEWNRMPNQKNDKLDCVTGCYAGAAFLGASMSGGERNWRMKKPMRETRKPKVEMEI